MTSKRGCFLFNKPRGMTFRKRVHGRFAFFEPVFFANFSSFLKSPMSILMTSGKMFRTICHQFKVFQRIIKGIPVFVMNNFFWFKFPPDMFFHKIAVFFNPSSFGNLYLPIIWNCFIDRSFSYWRRFAKSIYTSTRTEKLSLSPAIKLLFTNLAYFIRSPHNGNYIIVDMDISR